MIITNEKLEEILVVPGYIKKEEFVQCVELAEKNGSDLILELANKNLIKISQVGRLIAEEFNIKYVDFSKTKVVDEAIKLIPENVAKEENIIAFDQNEDSILVATSNPDDLETINYIEKKTGKKVEIYYSTKYEIENEFSKYQIGLKAEIENILIKLKNPETTKEESDSMTVLIVDRLLNYAFNNQSSDIHVEPQKEKALIRFRIDGLLHDVLEVPIELLDLIVTRIKVLCKLRTDQRKAAQDGKFQFEIENEGGKTSIDVRVSIVPVTSGENVVMRLLSSHIRQFSLQDIGFSDSDRAKILKAIENPHGMILVTGPTGSGKTTTLYSVLKILNKREIHISTIEDPVEYDIDGVSQIQVDNNTGLTFSKGLRSIVRQDPDIIMVGEIRDEETAGIAVNSAMTGHLVLSTLHTNDAATTLPRLSDLGVEPFLTASTVKVIIAQRLVRKICENCKTSHKLTTDEINLVKNDSNISSAFNRLGKKNIEDLLFFKGAGCKVCHRTGYAGRIGIFEILYMDDDMKRMISEKATSDEIMKVAIKNGMSTMLEDGIIKSINSMTTLEEVLKATRE